MAIVLAYAAIYLIWGCIAAGAIAASVAMIVRGGH